MGLGAVVFIPDDWEKPRNRGNHLTKEDIQSLRASFNCGLTPREAARKILCSSRIAYKYFAIFRNGILPHREKIKVVKFRPNRRVQDAPRHAEKTFSEPKTYSRESRFYRGNFEL